ncbi:hypothetical protein [Acrocarpospora catenulata]|nr:hypothetical protein [Acrocarpospora catenulata]
MNTPVLALPCPECDGYATAITRDPGTRTLVLIQCHGCDGTGTAAQ